MISKQKIARISGALYFAFLVFSGFSQLIRSKLIIADNVIATVNNIKMSELLFRISIVSDLIGFTTYVFTALFLYRLLKSVDKTYALLMVVLVFVGVPIAMLNILNLYAPVFLLSGMDYLKVFDANLLNAQVMLFLNLYEQGTRIAGIFWGLWLIPFGYLIFKSKFLPKILGILLIVGSFGFVFEFLVYFLLPDYKVITYPGMAIGAIAELSTIFWLVVFGIKDGQQISSANGSAVSVRRKS